MSTLPPLISSDGHLEVRPERWTPRMPARHREHAPRTIKLRAVSLSVAEGSANAVLGATVAINAHAAAKMHSLELRPRCSKAIVFFL